MAARILACASIDKHGAVVFTSRCPTGWEYCLKRLMNDAMICQFFGCFEVVDYVALVKCYATQEDDMEY